MRCLQSELPAKTICGHKMSRVRLDDDTVRGIYEFFQGPDNRFEACEAGVYEVLQCFFGVPDAYRVDAYQVHAVPDEEGQVDAHTFNQSKLFGLSFTRFCQARYGFEDGACPDGMYDLWVELWFKDGTNHIFHLDPSAKW